MVKVRLKVGRINEGCSNNELIDNLYRGYQAYVVGRGVDDGVYYVSNFPKDEVLVVKGGSKYQGIKNDQIYDNNVLINKKSLHNVYVVKPADTMEKICKICNITSEELIEKNRLKTTKLFVGQRLFINV